MTDNNIILVLIILILIINSFIVGYLLGRSTNNTDLNSRPNSFFKQQDSLSKDKSSIYIDDKKFVVDIKTEGLEKKYDSLGDIKKSEENISNSVNKLKNLKR